MPGLQTLFGYLVDLGLTAQAGVTVNVSLRAQQAIDPAILSKAKITDTTDANGYFELQVVKGAQVTVRVGNSYSININITQDNSKNLSTYTGV